MTKRTTLRLDDDRARLIERAKEIVAAGPSDDPPVSVVIDAVANSLREFAARRM